MIAKNKNNPGYTVKDKRSKYHGYNLKQLEDEQYKLNILKTQYDYAENLRKMKPFVEQLQEKKIELKTPKKQEKRETTQTPLEKAVMSRRPAFEPSDNEDDFSEQEWETSGSGIVDEAEKLINQLYVSLGSIKAGNNSMKLN